MGFKESSIHLLLINGLLLMYDLITLPIYAILHQPWRKIQRHKSIKAEQISTSDSSIIFKCTDQVNGIHADMKRNGIDTMDKLFTYAVSLHQSKKCLGTRTRISEEDEKQKDGKVFKKLVLGGYLWKSYKNVDTLANNFGKGLRSIGVKLKGMICIVAETREEWLVAAIAAFKQNFTLVTLYATLGEDGIIHGINETECEYILTSYEMMPKFKHIVDNSPTVKHLIYMEDQLRISRGKDDYKEFRSGVHIHTFNQIVEKGKEFITTEASSPPKSEDLALIMYTSGTTGNPKGVQLSHKNLVTSIMNLTGFLGPISPSSDVYMGYLPLAHIFEMMFESICLVLGIPIGYSSPLTMTNDSSKIKRGCDGDSVVLKPTILTFVPLILERIYKGIHTQIKQSGPLRQGLFKLFYDYKLKWYYRGFGTPLLDATIFKGIRQILGGRLRICVVGGAPLSTETQEFIKTCLSTPVLVGYGLTEVAACASISNLGDMTLGRAGAPLAGDCELQLINWQEGNYTVKDKPYPRGEVLIGGNQISIGYYKMGETTDFYESGGQRWFKSGDIAQLYPDGVIKIIDRKKDLVKLQGGEYVSFGKVETALLGSSFVENICVYADPTKLFCVALVVPNAKNLKNLSTKIGKPDLTLEQMCNDQEIEKTILKDLNSLAISSKLQRFEIPGAIKLCKEIWTTDLGLLTAAFKLKRKNIQDYYQTDIDQMYFR